MVLLLFTLIGYWEEQGHQAQPLMLSIRYRGLHMDNNPSNDHMAAMFHEEVIAHTEALHAYKNVQFWTWAKCEDFCVLQNRSIDTPSSFNTFQKVFLTRCRNAQCLDRRDKVYGMLALVSRHLAEVTTVDYETDVTTTYTAFSKAWIKTHRSLELLKKCGASG
jgi:hypothetical protein